MNCVFKRVTALVLTTALAGSCLSACSSKYEGINYEGVTINMDDSPYAIENLVLSFTTGSDMTTQNPISNTSSSVVRVTSNVYDGLVWMDLEGNPIPSVAESWEHSDDYKTWTFHLRDDAYWVDVKGEIQRTVTAEDFVTGLEWALNFGENKGEVLRVAYDYIAGGKEYYEYTKELDEETAKNPDYDAFTSMVGVEATDDYTVIYKTCKPCPYFLSLLVCSDFMPAPRDHIKELGADTFYANPYYSAWFNGPYIMTEFIVDNEKILDANPHWFGNDEHTRFKSITFRAVEDKSVAYQLYKNKELDYIELSQSQLKKIYENPEHEFYSYINEGNEAKYYYQILFNYDRRNEDGEYDEDWNKAAANESFRKALYYGLDMSQVLKNFNIVYPYHCEVNTLNPQDLNKYSDGTDYVDAVEERLDLSEYDGQKSRRVNKELAEYYKAKAIEELTAQGVEFPIVINEYCLASSQSDIDSEMIYKQAFEDSLGKDFVTIEIGTYVSSYSAEVLTPKLNSIKYQSWGPDYADPTSVLFQYRLDDTAYCQQYMNILDYDEADIYYGDKQYLKDTYEAFRTYTEMYEQADTVMDNDARLDAFADLEAYYYSRALAVPYKKSKPWVLSRIDINTMSALAYGPLANRYVDNKTNKNGYQNNLKEGEEK